MKDLEEFLATLKGAGFTLPESLGDDVKGQLKGALGMADEVQAEITKARQERDEFEARYKGMTKTDSEKDRRIKELEARLNTNPGDMSAQYQAHLEKIQNDVGGKLQTLLDKLEAQERTNTELAAKVARSETVSRLSKELPILSDPEFQSLIPITADETVLRERAQMLMKFKEKTETDALERIRSGYVPATAPPKVIPGNDATFQREARSIEDMAKTGKITPIEAMNQLDRLMQEYTKT